MSTGDSQNCGKRRYESLVLAVHLPSRRFPCQRAQHLTGGYREGSNAARLGVLVDQSSACTARQACRSLPRGARRRLSFHSVSTHFTVRNSFLDRVYHGLQGW